MGGDHEFKDSKLRIHRGDKDGKVHIHSDEDSVKFVLPVDEFKTKYAILKEDALKSNLGLIFDETGQVELHARVEGGKVKFNLRNKVQGFEKFDGFIADLAKA